MTTLKVTTAINSIGVLRPKDIRGKSRVSKGHTLYVLERPDGIELTPYRPDFAKQMDLAREVMHENRDVLRQLSE